MSYSLDVYVQKYGTCFLIFPQNRYLTGFHEPENALPESIKPGPEDDRMYVVDAMNKKPYLIIKFPPYKRKFDNLMPIQPNSNEHTKNLKIIMKQISYKYADGNTGYYIDKPGVVWKYALKVSRVIC